jgi:hypothetical protein
VPASVVEGRLAWSAALVVPLGHVARHRIPWRGWAIGWAGLSGSLSEEHQLLRTRGAVSSPEYLVNPHNGRELDACVPPRDWSVWCHGGDRFVLDEPRDVADLGPEG